MLTVPQIVAKFGGPTEFGKICGWTENAAARGSDIRRRESIPVAYWKKIIEAAEERKLPITYETLVAAHVRKK